MSEDITNKLRKQLEEENFNKDYNRSLGTLSIWNKNRYSVYDLDKKEKLWDLAEKSEKDFINEFTDYSNKLNVSVRETNRVIINGGIPVITTIEIPAVNKLDPDEIDKKKIDPRIYLEYAKMIELLKNKIELQRMKQSSLIFNLKAKLIEFLYNEEMEARKKGRFTNGLYTLEELDKKGILEVVLQAINNEKKYYRVFEQYSLPELLDMMKDVDRIKTEDLKESNFISKLKFEDYDSILKDYKKLDKSIVLQIFITLLKMNIIIKDKTKKTNVNELIIKIKDKFIELYSNELTKPENEAVRDDIINKYITINDEDVLYCIHNMSLFDNSGTLWNYHTKKLLGRYIPPFEPKYYYAENDYTLKVKRIKDLNKPIWKSVLDQLRLWLINELFPENVDKEFIDKHYSHSLIFLRDHKGDINDFMASNEWIQLSLLYKVIKYMYANRNEIRYIDIDKDVDLGKDMELTEYNKQQLSLILNKMSKQYISREKYNDIITKKNHEIIFSKDTETLKHVMRLKPIYISTNKDNVTNNVVKDEGNIMSYVPRNNNNDTYKPIRSAIKNYDELITITKDHLTAISGEIYIDVFSIMRGLDIYPSTSTSNENYYNTSIDKFNKDISSIDEVLRVKLTNREESRSKVYREFITEVKEVVRSGKEKIKSDLEKMATNIFNSRDRGYDLSDENVFNGVIVSDPNNPFNLGYGTYLDGFANYLASEASTKSNLGFVTNAAVSYTKKNIRTKKDLDAISSIKTAPYYDVEDETMAKYLKLTDSEANDVVKTEKGNKAVGNLKINTKLNLLGLDNDSKKVTDERLLQLGITDKKLAIDLVKNGMLKMDLDNNSIAVLNSTNNTVRISTVNAVDPNKNSQFNWRDYKRNDLLSRKYNESIPNKEKYVLASPNTNVTYYDGKNVSYYKMSDTQLDKNKKSKLSALNVVNEYGELNKKVTDPRLLELGLNDPVLVNDLISHKWLRMGWGKDTNFVVAVLHPMRRTVYHSTKNRNPKGVAPTFHWGDIVMNPNLLERLDKVNLSGSSSGANNVDIPEWNPITYSKPNGDFERTYGSNSDNYFFPEIKEESKPYRDVFGDGAVRATEGMMGMLTKSGNKVENVVKVVTGIVDMVTFKDSNVNMKILTDDEIKREMNLDELMNNKLDNKYNLFSGYNKNVLLNSNNSEFGPKNTLDISDDPMRKIFNVSNKDLTNVYTGNLTNKAWSTMTEAQREAYIAYRKRLRKQQMDAINTVKKIRNKRIMEALLGTEISEDNKVKMAINNGANSISSHLNRKMDKHLSGYYNALDKIDNKVDSYYNKFNNRIDNLSNNLERGVNRIYDRIDEGIDKVDKAYDKISKVAAPMVAGVGILTGLIKGTNDFSNKALSLANFLSGGSNNMRGIMGTKKVSTGKDKFNVKLLKNAFTSISIEGRKLEFIKVKNYYEEFDFLNSSQAKRTLVMDVPKSQHEFFKSFPAKGVRVNIDRAYTFDYMDQDDVDNLGPETAGIYRRKWKVNEIIENVYIGKIRNMSEPGPDMSKMTDEELAATGDTREIRFFEVTLDIIPVIASQDSGLQPIGVPATSYSVIEAVKSNGRVGGSKGSIFNEVFNSVKKDFGKGLIQSIKDRQFNFNTVMKVAATGIMTYKAAKSTWDAVKQESRTMKEYLRKFKVDVKTTKKEVKTSLLKPRRFNTRNQVFENTDIIEVFKKDREVKLVRRDDVISWNELSDQGKVISKYRMKRQRTTRFSDNLYDPFGVNKYVGFIGSRPKTIHGTPIDLDTTTYNNNGLY